MAQAELFFAMLQGGHPLEELKELDLEGFDWSTLHPSGHTLLVTFLDHALARPPDRFEEALDIVDWLILSGASIGQKCSASKHSTILWFGKDAGAALEVDSKNCSAVAYVTAWQEKMKDTLQWQKESGFLAKVLTRFARASGKQARRPRVSIDEGIAELWEKCLAAKDSHDLTIEAADGPVTAHAHMVKAASPVIAAMLVSPMKEGKAQRIEIKDTSSGAVSLFLEILYTCSAQQEPEYETALHALDLAHRWQVDVVVAILSDLLAGMITDTSFSVIAEHAALKGLEQLKTAAKNFGATSKKVQADLKGGRLPAAVLQLFPAASKPSKANEPKPKRRRM